MKQQTGFTLIELVVTISVVAILAVVAFPSMRTLVQNNRATAHANEFITSLNLARSEALKRQRAVTVLPAVGGFGSGWTVFADLNGNGVMDNGEEISVFGALGGGSVLTSTVGTGAVTFGRDGTVGATRAFELRVSGCRGDQGRNISISRVGRVAVAKVPCT